MFSGLPSIKLISIDHPPVSHYSFLSQLDLAFFSPKVILLEELLMQRCVKIQISFNLKMILRSNEQAPGCLPDLIFCDYTNGNEISK